MLGSSDPRRRDPKGSPGRYQRRPALLELFSQGESDAPITRKRGVTHHLQSPSKHLSPAWGQRVGGVSRRPARGTGSGEIFFSRHRDATVKGTRLLRTPAVFADCRKNVELGRPVATPKVSSFEVVRAGDKGCPLVSRRRGTSSACVKRMHSTSAGTRERDHRRFEDDVLHSVQRPVLRLRRASDETPFGIAVGQTCVSRRNRHRDRIRADDVRLAASRWLRFPESTREVRNGRRSRPPSLRGNESPGRCPYVVSSCRSR